MDILLFLMGVTATVFTAAKVGFIGWACYKFFTKGGSNG